MKKYLTLFCFFLLGLNWHALGFAEDKQLRDELRAGPWFLDNNNKHLDVVLELPGGAPPLVAGNLTLRLDGGRDIMADGLKSYQASGHPLAWLVCLESAGVLAEPMLKPTKTALLSLFKDRQSLEVALFTYGKGVNKILTFEKNRRPSDLTRAITGLKPPAPGSVKLYQSLLTALDYLEQASASGNLAKRKRILLIANGRDVNDSAGYQAVIDRASALGIPIDTVGVPLSKTAGSETAALDLLAGATGGHFTAVPAGGDLAAALTNLHRVLTETQTVTVSFPLAADPKLTAKQADIILRLPAGNELKARLDAQNLPLPMEKPPETKPAPSSPQPKIETNTPSTSPVPKPKSYLWIVWAVGFVGVLAVLIWTTLSGRKKPERSPRPGDRFIVAEIRNEHKTAVQARKTVVGGQNAQHTRISSIWLQGVGGAVNGLKIEINKPEFTLGSNNQNDFSIRNDEFASGSHAVIRTVNGKYYLRDQNSRNGTFVNEVKLGDNAFELSAGDRIRIGASIFLVSNG